MHTLNVFHSENSGNKANSGPRKAMFQTRIANEMQNTYRLNHFQKHLLKMYIKKVNLGRENSSTYATFLYSRFTPRVKYNAAHINTCLPRCATRQISVLIEAETCISLNPDNAPYSCNIPLQFALCRCFI